MERKLVQFTTWFTCIFSLFVCVIVWFLPVLEQSLEDFNASIRQTRIEREERYAMLKQMSGLEILDYNTQQAMKEVEEQEESIKDGDKEKNKETGTGKNKDRKKTVKEDQHEISGYLKEQMMRLELPEHTSGSDVKIIPDYAGQQINVQLPGADQNYLYDYQLIGKNDRIINLDYTSHGGAGTIALKMDRVMEVESSYDEKYLYLDFKTPKEIYDRVVVVDAGHGGSAPGAVSGDIYEKNITLAIVQQLKAMFDEAGNSRVGVYYTRLDDTDPDFSDRVGLANNSGADLFVSVHINSVKGTAGEGVEVMYNEQAPDTAFDTKDFAQILLDHEVKSLGAVNRGLIPGNKIYIIRNALMPAALVEVGFMNNPTELSNLLDASYQKRAAAGIYKGIMDSLDQINEIEGE